MLCRSAGLFAPGDTLLAELGADPAAFPFEKLLAGGEGPNQALVRGGWATGNEAAEHGFDLRMFYKVSAQLDLQQSRGVSPQLSPPSPCSDRCCRVLEDSTALSA